MASLQYSWWWLTAILSCLLIGCPTSSEWDREWERMHANFSQGQVKEAKKLLHGMLSSARERGPSDERYALIIFQLGEISRLEGQDIRQRRIIGNPSPCSASP